MAVPRMPKAMPQDRGAIRRFRKKSNPPCVLPTRHRATHHRFEGENDREGSF